MSPDLVFDRSLDAAYGVPVPLGPGLARLLAPNPGPFTFRGTGVYLVGQGAVMVIDPGPDLPDHLAALKRALEGRRVSHILITHAHRDHWPAARALSAWSGAKIHGVPLRPFSAPLRPSLATGASALLEEEADVDFHPDIALGDGDVIEGDGVTMDCVSTPGHAAGHMCFAWREQKALFSGDHVMGWSTSVVAPPDGDMAQYMASLEKLIARDDLILYPTHGSPILEPRAWLQALLAHRKAREAEILANLPATVEEIVERLYGGIASGLRAAAAQTVTAHLIKLVKEGRAVVADGRYRAA